VEGGGGAGGPVVSGAAPGRRIGAATAKTGTGAMGGAAASAAPAWNGAKAQSPPLPPLWSCLFDPAWWPLCTAGPGAAAGQGASTTWPRASGTGIQPLGTATRSARASHRSKEIKAGGRCTPWRYNPRAPLSTRVKVIPPCCTGAVLPAAALRSVASPSIRRSSGRSWPPARAAAAHRSSAPGRGTA